MNTLIFLDDERNFEDVTWIKYPRFENIMIVRNSLEFKTLIKTFSNFNNISFSFDHDLQDYQKGEETTGYDCIKWLLNYLDDREQLKQIHQYYVHTQNPIGKENISAYIQNYYRVVCDKRSY